MKGQPDRQAKPKPAPTEVLAKGQEVGNPPKKPESAQPPNEKAAPENQKVVETPPSAESNPKKVAEVAKPDDRKPAETQKKPEASPKPEAEKKAIAKADGPKPEAEKKAAPKPETPPFVDVATEFDEDRKPTIQTGGSVLIKDATILTVTKGTIPKGSILIEKGKIKAVGEDLSAPEGVKVIEASGLVAMPGIIDTHSHIAIQGGVNEMSLSIVPEVRVKDVVTGDDVAIYRALAGGTTTARLLHGSANTIGGQDAVIKLRYGKAGRDLIIRDAPQGVKFALGENVTRSHRAVPQHPDGRRGRPSSGPSRRRRAYRATWKAYKKPRRARTTARPDTALPRPDDLRLEALAGVLDGLDQDPQPLLPERRDPDAAPHRPELRRAGPVAPARPRGLQGRRRDRRARRERLDLLRLVGLQDRGVTTPSRTTPPC